MELARGGVPVDQEAVHAALTSYGLDILTASAQNVRRLRIHFLGLIEDRGDDHESVGQCGTCEEKFVEGPEACRETCPFCGASFGDDDVVEVMATCRTITDLIQLGIKHADAGRLAMWELGVFLRQVQSHELWKTPDGDGNVPFKSFREFHERIKVAHRMVYELIRLVRLSSRDDFLLYGRTKLTVVTTIPPGSKRDGVDQAMREGASRRTMEKLAGAGNENPESENQETPETTRSTIPSTLTIVASVEPDRPRKLDLMRFTKRAENIEERIEELGEAVAVAEVSGCYGELEISQRVFLQVGVEIEDGKLSLHAVFRESPDDLEE